MQLDSNKIIEKLVLKIATLERDIAILLTENEMLKEKLEEESKEEQMLEFNGQPPVMKELEGANNG